MAPCGIARIDGLLSGQAGILPIGPGDPDKESVGLIQDLLIGHGAKGLPNLLSSQYGLFGPHTAAALAAFCSQQGLTEQKQIGSTLFQSLVQAPASSPMACRAYLTLVLDIPYTGITKILSLVAQMEGGGKFAALNRNTDRAGLSFGLIQWAQKPRRLAEILTAFEQAEPDEFVRIFGDGDPRTSRELIAHTRKPKGGIDSDGFTTDPAFDLTEEPWISRFKQAASFVPFQKVQVQTAMAAFEKSLDKLKQFAPQLKSERSIAFMLDVANQFGDGGAQSLLEAVQKDGMTESELLAAIAEESVKRIQANAQDGTKARRDNFLATNFLSDNPFDDTHLSPDQAA